MTKPIIIAIVVAITAMIMSSVSAAEERQVRSPISIADVEARTNAKFTGADSNMDGLLSSEEFAQLRLERPGAKSRGPLEKRNGKAGKRGPINRQRAAEQKQIRAAAAKEMFRLLDTNADGVIDADEYTRADSRKLRHQAHKRVAFAQLDVNNDGFLAPSEMPSPVLRLQRLDTDGDGQVSKREMRKGMRAQRRADDS
ncbi:MAG: hypothetical protein CMP86_09640 [Gammaproteobacteria bacterium]|mgnify:CR=1 FL=1|nr:hypothetical protein [Gammaproteobacteria bacterium]